jgi:hypothetical protein
LFENAEEESGVHDVAFTGVWLGDTDELVILNLWENNGQRISGQLIRIRKGVKNKMFTIKGKYFVEDVYHILVIGGVSVDNNKDFVGIIK